MWTCERWPCVKGRCQVKTSHHISVKQFYFIDLLNNYEFLKKLFLVSLAVGVRMGVDFSSLCREKLSSTV